MTGFKSSEDGDLQKKGRLVSKTVQRRIFRRKGKLVSKTVQRMIFRRKGRVCLKNNAEGDLKGTVS